MNQSSCEGQNRFAFLSLSCQPGSPGFLCPGESLPLCAVEALPPWAKTCADGCIEINRSGEFLICFGLAYRISKACLPAALALSVDGIVRAGAILAYGPGFAKEGWLSRQAVLALPHCALIRLFNAGEKPIAYHPLEALRAYLTLVKLA